MQQDDNPPEIEAGGDRAPDALRHRQLTNLLRRQIESGELRVGTRLLPERELSLSHGVSRATVREALRKLELLGMITRVQGAGTTVTSSMAQVRSQAIQSVDAFFQYAEGTSLDIFRIEPAEDALLAEVGLDRRTHPDWLVSHMLRRDIRTDQPVSFTRGFVPAQYRAVFEHERCTHVPIYQILRHNLGMPMSTGSIEIQPVILPIEVKALLHPEDMTGTAVPGFCLNRTYRTGGQQIQMRALSWHPRGIGGFRAEIPID